MTNILKLLPCLMLAACASTSPDGMRSFGNMSRAAFARQVIVPEPPPGNVTGIDGAAALQIQQAYRKSYAEPVRPAAPLVVSFGAH
jgi:hypothetical protein